MSPADIILLLLVALILYVSIKRIHRSRKQGVCAGCAHAKTCHNACQKNIQTKNQEKSG